MKRREIKRKNKKGAPQWIVTYSDMITLILVFFILLFSMSRLDSLKFDAVSESFQSRGIFDFQASTMPMDYPASDLQEQEFDSAEMQKNNDTNDAMDKDQQKDALNQLVDDVETYLDENKLHNVITANRTDRGVVLVLQEKILFETGEAEILPSGEPFLNKVASLLKSMPNQVKVEGHSDDRPISTFRYPSNWELSGARASSVVRYFIQQYDLDETRFSLAGYGDTRPRVPNNSPQNWKKNRRVEIVIMENEQEK